MRNILLVEDDQTIRECIVEFLNQVDYHVYDCEDAEEGLKIWEREDIHLIILDIMLPGISGLDMLKEIRGVSQVPVVILTALNDEQTQIKLFDELADDYLTKPFSLMILKKRIEAQFRHFYHYRERVEFGRAEVDFKGFKAYYERKEVNMTTKEFQILEYLLENQGITVSRTQILNHVWCFNEEPYERVIDVYIKNLRQKLHMECIKTVKGIGYRLEMT